MPGDPSLGNLAFDPALATADAVATRDAATIILVRDDPEGGAAVGTGSPGEPGGPLQVLLLRKHIKADFAGGAHVFPGGAVDPADRSERAADLCPSRQDGDASLQLDVECGGLAFWVAAVRECFEEAGILLAYGPDGSPLSFSDPEVAGRFRSHREELNAGRRSFEEICRKEGLTLAVDRVHYFSHWITPEGAPRRYDTRFFVGEAPDDQSALNDGSETVENIWVSPGEALRLGEEGRMALIFPTIRNLQAAGRFGTAAELVAAARAIERVPANLPRIRIEGREVRILLPGDPGYDELVAG